MFFRAEKKEKKPAAAPRACSGCGLLLSDPLWRVCPRCRTETTGACGGCRDCGRCAK